MRCAVLIFVLIAGFVAPAGAEPFEDGLVAYGEGDYATALKHWRPLAERGRADAQSSLGWMYAKGEGLPRDDVEAAKWYRRAAEQGHADARKNLSFMREKDRGATTKAPPAPARGDFLVQLGAVKQEARAVKEARRLNRVHQSLLGSLKIVPVRADLGERGVFYRLRTGPLNDRASAKTLCRKLSALEQGCIVVKP